MGEAVTEEAGTEEAVAEEAVAEEAVAEEAVAEEAAAEEPAAEEAAAEEPVIEESVEEEEDGPLEDWTVKELKEECKTLGIADKGKKAELIARIKEFRSSSMEVAVEAGEDAPVIEEIAEKEVVAEEAPVEEAPVEETPVEAPVEESTVEETPVEETPVEEEPVDETPVAEAPVEEVTEETTTDETESQSAGLDPSSISELLAKNEQGQLSQQEFFRIFLVSVQNSLTTNQRLADVEKKLDETAERLEKIEVAADSVSNATTEPETHIEETEEASVVEAETVATEEPAAEESAADPMEETDITSLVENAEKLQPRISRKRAHVSGHQKKSARAKRTRV